jgi:hypothetical protein
VSKPGLDLHPKLTRDSTQSLLRCASGSHNWPVITVNTVQRLSACCCPSLCAPLCAAGATAAQAAHSHIFSISGGPLSRSGLTGCIYWLGRYAAGKFDLAAAAGPTLLDLGDLMYAPNLLTVPAQVGARKVSHLTSDQLTFAVWLEGRADNH